MPIVLRRVSGQLLSHPPLWAVVDVMKGKKVNLVVAAAAAHGERGGESRTPTQYK